MIINRSKLFALKPIKNMLGAKYTEHGVSHGLSEAGYDIRIKQEVRFIRKNWMHHWTSESPTMKRGKFVLASTVEEFQMPPNLVGIVHDKSTWARKGLSVFNTVIEPGWNGFLTLELVYHGQEDLIIPAGAGIAQVIFHETTNHAQYAGKYQNQENKPVAAKES